MLLSEEKSVKTTINIKKVSNISAGRVINMHKLVNTDFYNIQTYRYTFLDNLDIQDFQNITDLYEFIF